MMKELFYILLVVFLLFGFFRRFIYFQAYSSFTKAAEDFQRKSRQPVKPEGTVTIGKAPEGLNRGREDDFVDYEEVK